MNEIMLDRKQLQKEIMGPVKKKKSRNGHLTKFYRLKIGAPERNKCLELLTLLPYHIPTQSDGHTHHCQNMPCY